VWFAGVHCDIGGVYPESESGLSKIALQWMLDEAIQAGLLVDEHKMEAVLGGSPGFVKPDPQAQAHESLSLAWWPAEFLLKRHFDWHRNEWSRRMNLGRRRTMPLGSVLHPSVYQRGADYLARLPEPLRTPPSDGLPGAS
jgi:hypothetical protein